MNMNNIYVYYTLLNWGKFWAEVQEGLASSFQACVWVLSDFMRTQWLHQTNPQSIPSFSCHFLNYEG